MGFSTRYLRIPRPEVSIPFYRRLSGIVVDCTNICRRGFVLQTFLYVMSLETGASLITMSLLLNKISGLYGLLALLTGYQLSPIQLSMYIYSLIVLGLTALLFPHIRQQSPLQCLSLAWIYSIDSLINAAYTAGFAVSWFMVISQHYGKSKLKSRDATSLDAKITDASNFVRSNDGLSAVLQPESMPSIVFICALWVFRAYFVFVMLAFARRTLRLYISVPRHTQLPTHSRTTSVASMADIDREPFSAYSPDGQGWKGKLGRTMISIGRGYWLDEEEDPNRVSRPGGIHRRFRSFGGSTDLSGPIERERRRRSGTGPPQPSPSIFQPTPMHPPIPEQPPSKNGKPQNWSDGR